MTEFNATTALNLLCVEFIAQCQKNGMNEAQIKIELIRCLNDGTIEARAKQILN